MINTTLDYLKWVATFDNAYEMRFLIEHGRPGGPFVELPADEDRFPLGECFRNAFLLAEMSGLKYVEGYAKHIIPMHHAWCEDEDGNILDPTWPSGEDYWGVAFSVNWVRKSIAAKGTWGILGERLNLSEGLDRSLV